MTHLTLADRLTALTVDLQFAATPTTVRIDDGRDRAVAAAAYLPPREGERPVHLVVYNRGADELITADDQNWAVSIRYQHEELGITYLAHGDYDLTFAEAMTRFAERLQKQG